MKKNILIIFLFATNLSFGQPPLNIDSIGIIEPSNPSVCDGSFTIYVSGGCTPYYYSWGCVDFNPANGQCCGECPFQITDSCGTIVGDTLRWCGGITTSTHNLDYPQNINTYPNPNKGTFTVQYESNEEEPLMLTIVELTGKIVHQELLNTGFNQQEVTTNNLETGFYFINIKTQSGILTYSTKMSIVK